VTIAASIPPADMLAPPPDFRYVGLEAGPRVQLGLVAGLAGVAATSFATAAFGMRGMLIAAAGALATSIALRGAGLRNGRLGGWLMHGVPMAIVPWGILVEPAERARVLRWAGVARVDAQTIYGKDTGTPTSRWSVVTVETPREKLSGRAPGAVPIERLLVHHEAYARESSHVMALDLNGEIAGEGPTEPEFSQVLAAARAWLVGAPASQRLGLPAGGYRSAAAAHASPEAVAELRAVLRDRTAKRIDPRAFAAVLAAELGAKDLAEDLVKLEQCPHPLIAAVAKTAARKLGTDSPTGDLEEVAPFLMAQDVEALEAWAAAR
jgi:hypothetical protein